MWITSGLNGSIVVLQQFICIITQIIIEGFCNIKAEGVGHTAVIVIVNCIFNDDGTRSKRCDKVVLVERQAGTISIRSINLLVEVSWCQETTEGLCFTYTVVSNTVGHKLGAKGCQYSRSVRCPVCIGEIILLPGINIAPGGRSGSTCSTWNTYIDPVIEYRRNKSIFSIDGETGNRKLIWVYQGTHILSVQDVVTGIQYFQHINASGSSPGSSHFTADFLQCILTVTAVWKEFIKNAGSCTPCIVICTVIAACNGRNLQHGNTRLQICTDTSIET